MISPKFCLPWNSNSSCQKRYEMFHTRPWGLPKALVSLEFQGMGSLLCKVKFFALSTVQWEILSKIFRFISNSTFCILFFLKQSPVKLWHYFWNIKKYTYLQTLKLLKYLELSPTVRFQRGAAKLSSWVKRLWLPRASPSIVVPPSHTTWSTLH